MDIKNQTKTVPMDCEACQAFILATLRQFNYLFQDYKFGLLGCNEAHEGAYCLVLTENHLCRILFMLEDGVPSVSFGTLLSPMIWSHTVGDVQVWYPLNTLLAFLDMRDGRTPERQSLFERIRAGEFGAQPEIEDTLEQMLAESAQRLYPRVDELVAAFGPDRQPQWWQAFDQFVEDQLRELDL